MLNGNHIFSLLMICSAMEHYEPGSCLEIKNKTPQQFDTKIYKFDDALFDAENWFSKLPTQPQQIQRDKIVHQWNLHSHRGQYRMAVKKLEGLKKYPFNNWKQFCASQYLKKTIGKAEINNKHSINDYRGDYYYFYPTKDTNNIAFIINPNLSKTQNARKVLQRLAKKIPIEKFSNCDALFDAEQRNLVTKSLANWQFPKQKPQWDPLSSWKQRCKRQYESNGLKNCLTPHESKKAETADPSLTRDILKKQLQTCAWCNNILWKGKQYLDRCNKCRGLPIEIFKEDFKPRFSTDNNTDWINDKYIL